MLGADHVRSRLATRRGRLHVLCIAGIDAVIMGAADEIDRRLMRFHVVRRVQFEAYQIILPAMLVVAVEVMN